MEVDITVEDITIILHTTDTTVPTEQDTTMDIIHTAGMGSHTQIVMEITTDTAITKAYK